MTNIPSNLVMKSNAPVVKMKHIYNYIYTNIGVKQQQKKHHTTKFTTELNRNKLSKPQPQHNTTVGFDMKMTVQTTPPPTPTQTF